MKKKNKRNLIGISFLVLALLILNNAGQGPFTSAGTGFENSDGESGFSISRLNAFSTAVPCSPDSGYDVCYAYEKRNTFDDARARAYAEIQTTASPVGEKQGGIYTSDVVLPYKFVGDNFYLYDARNIRDWNQFWNYADCGANDCENYDKILTNQGEVTLANLGENYDGCPVLVAQDFDRAETSNAWATAWVYTAYGWIDDNGDGKCLGITSKQAECFIDADCGDVTIGQKFCQANSSVSQVETPFCENFECSVKVDFPSDECEFGCSDGNCNSEPEEPPAPEFNELFIAIPIIIIIGVVLFLRFRRK